MDAKLDAKRRTCRKIMNGNKTFRAMPAFILSHKVRYDIETQSKLEI
jgi:hypothetical protein